jgi:hypothetical protein
MFRAKFKDWEQYNPDNFVDPRDPNNRRAIEDIQDGHSGRNHLSKEEKHLEKEERHEEHQREKEEKHKNKHDRELNENGVVAEKVWRESHDNFWHGDQD